MNGLTVNSQYHFLSSLALGIFVFSYLMVMIEEFIKLRKSKPVVLAAGVIWMIIAWIALQQHENALVTKAFQNNLREYAELLLFLLVAMTYIHVMEECQIFKALGNYLTKHQFSLRQLFWITGILAFFISSIADNLTTSILMCAVILTIGKSHPKFVALSCINIVSAANAGGAFSPFGDITTLMVWQAGIIPFAGFFKLFLPALISYVVPAACMHYFIPKAKLKPMTEEVTLAKGSSWVILFFLLTLVTTVLAHGYFHLPPVMGMMMGLGFLKILNYFLTLKGKNICTFDVFKNIQRIEWDTLLYFYGIIMCIGGLALLGYLEMLSHSLYPPMTETTKTAHSLLTHPYTHANFWIGIISSILDNIPIMYAILSIYPKMSEGQWLLVTLTTGIGGSLLSIGSAAGVALMGQAPKVYTFFHHLKWSWAILLGYLASIGFHLWWNADLF